MHYPAEYMHNPIPLVHGILGAVAALTLVAQARGQTATVSLNSQKQYIRGYGGMVHSAWTGTSGDMNAAERTLAFGNAEGQLGFTVLRIPVSDGSPDSANLTAAQAAVAAGGIVYATPWNAKGSMNSSDFASYATHLNDFVAYYKGKGVDLYAISVQNEPDYATQGGWRSWTAAQCHDFILNYGATITTKLISCESFNYAKSLYDPILNDSAALANMDILGTHLYGTSVSGYSYSLFDSKGAGKERWMTEHYTDSNTDANSWPNALNVATELHHAMVEGSFNVYTWWYIKRSYGPINNGAVTKRGWCMAHWSKFVRPGYNRVDATASPTSGVFLSAYKGGADVVIVVVNTNTSTKSISVTVDGSTLSSYDRYTTSSSKSFASEGKVSVSGGTLSLSLDASSVTTLHGSGAPTDSGGSPGTGGASSTGGAANGDASTGGTSGSNTARATGGSQNAGGKTGLGGAKSTGSTPATGGVAASTSAVATGGSKSTGGTISSGGQTQIVEPTGGALGAGGSPATDGGQSSDTGTIGTTAGMSGNAGSGTTVGNVDQQSSDEGSCSCRIPVDRSNSPKRLLGLLAILAIASWRRLHRSRLG